MTPASHQHQHAAMDPPACQALPARRPSTVVLAHLQALVEEQPHLKTTTTTPAQKKKNSPINTTSGTHSRNPAPRRVTSTKTRQNYDTPSSASAQPHPSFRVPRPVRRPLLKKTQHINGNLAHLALVRVRMEPLRRLSDHDLRLLVHLRPARRRLGQRHSRPQPHLSPGRPRKCSVRRASTCRGRSRKSRRYSSCSSGRRRRVVVVRRSCVRTLVLFARRSGSGRAVKRGAADTEQCYQ